MATSAASKATAGDAGQKKTEVSRAGEISGTEAAIRALRHDVVHFGSIGKNTRSRQGHE